MYIKILSALLLTSSVFSLNYKLRDELKELDLNTSPQGILPGGCIRQEPIVRKNEIIKDTLISKKDFIGENLETQDIELLGDKNSLNNSKIHGEAHLSGLKTDITNCIFEKNFIIHSIHSVNEFHFYGNSIIHGNIYFPNTLICRCKNAHQICAKVYFHDNSIILGKVINGEVIKK